MKLLFLGSGDFAVPSLEALLGSSHTLAALVTQPDRPAGRGHRLRMPPTKSLALERSVPVYQPVKIRAPEAVERIRAWSPDCMVVVAYGQIIPASILAIPPRGIINVHASLLPAYRGAAPIAWAIVAGESETGVTTMLMNEGLDTGPILLQRPCAIDPADTAGSLERKLAPLGAALLLETLGRWERGDLAPVPQDDSRASLAPRIRKEDAELDWKRPAVEIARRIRGFNPWPVAHTRFEGTVIRIFAAEPVPERWDAFPPGETVAVERDAIVVTCGAGTALRLLEIQAEGKSRQRAGAFARGRRIEPGSRWGE